MGRARRFARCGVVRLRRLGRGVPNANVVLVPRIVEDGEALEEMLGGSVLGLGLSPRLLHEGSDDAAEFPDPAIAHELGHAYGLPHTEAAANLMRSGTRICSAGLDEDQRTTVDASLEAMALRAARPRLLSATHALPELIGRLTEVVRRPDPDDPSAPGRN